MEHMCYVSVFSVTRELFVDNAVLAALILLLESLNDILSST